MSFRSPVRFALALAALIGTAHAADYKVLETISLGGDGGWDYLLADGESQRLFISRATHVMVFDFAQKKLTGDIPDTPGVHGIALDPGSGKGFITAGRAGRVDIFDSKTLAKTGSASAGNNPDAITFDGATGTVLAFNGGSKDATLIDSKTGTVRATVALGGKPEAGVPDGKNHVFVNLEDLGEIADIDLAGGKVARKFKIEGCEEPSGLAIDSAHRRLFAGCGNKILAMVDADSGRTLGSVPIGEGVDACDFDPGPGYVFASTGDGHITIAKVVGGQLQVVQTIQTARGARTMSVDRTTHRAYTVTATFGPPPAPTAENPHPRPAILPGTFELIVVGPDGGR